MNNDRRRRLREAADLLQRAEEIVRQAAEEEQEAFDNLPEGIQQAERGQTMEADAGSLQSVADDVESAMFALQEVLPS